ncbi:MAG: (2Fe-2S)-binding protein [Rhodospirillaceae bacterium]|jgi:aerobic carbon-monoxide dehydrogenase small subunit|nr:(2Fe-2S)-binding protein [Rhodospirillaceae bacterium]MBT3885538.1 (2Fe-2S)-binding protein [Rhodospirillaceae bacterium]MBT4117929.1 (2Fe-2S)-binding protein [Rhodospirillaceae bacterium]MBT4671597.1 (2Fe-2S)-binding protein [Rhodospirillaceae bacterium]MBT4750935.1 (2Fe-2S)-binding protein [Rhodospirillaceae bacterium]
MKRVVQLDINGSPYDVMVAPNETLADVVRRKLGMTGTKLGCEQGDCGACTVLIDGKSHLSCLTLAVASEGKEITTIEGLESDGQLDPVQQAVLEKHGVQCGICTPGVIMSAKGLLNDNPKPSHDEVVVGLSGNLCRCTGYEKIFDAINAVANGEYDDVRPTEAGGE